MAFNVGSASADRISPRYEHPQVGYWIPMAKEITGTTAQLPARAAVSPGVPVAFSQNGKAACRRS